MNTKLLAAGLLLALVAGTITNPAEARRFGGFNGPGNWNNNGLHRGWGHHSGNGSCGMGNMGNSGNSGWGSNWGGQRLGFNSQYGGNQYGGNQLGGLVGQDSRLFSKQQKLQQLLSDPNISPSRAAFLQNELSRIQNRQTGLGGLLGNRLTGQQSRIQQLLASGNISPSEAARLQDRLNRIQSQQTALGGSGNPFADTSVWGRLGRFGL